MRNVQLNLVLSLAIFMSPLALFGQTERPQNKISDDTPASEDLNTILDHLETKMTDQDNFKPEDMNDSRGKRDLTTPKKARDLVPQNRASDQKQVPRQNNLKDIQTKINEYDNRIEILESDLRRLRANVYDASVTDNLVAIEIQPSEVSRFLIRDLRANLDGNTLYNRHDPSGLWMPSKSITLFHGPLHPGDHQVDVSAILVPLSAEGLKLPTSEHRNLDQSFRFTVPEGKQKRRLILEISHSTEDAPKPIARMIEGDAR